MLCKEINTIMTQDIKTKKTLAKSIDVRSHVRTLFAIAPKAFLKISNKKIDLFKN